MSSEFLTSEVVEKRISKDVIDITCDMVKEFMKTHTLKFTSNQGGLKANDNRKGTVSIETKEKMLSHYVTFYMDRGYSKEDALILASEFCRTNENSYSQNIIAIYEYLNNKKKLPPCSRTEIIYLLIKDAIHKSDISFIKNTSLAGECVYPVVMLSHNQDMKDELIQNFITKIQNMIKMRYSETFNNVFSGIDREPMKVVDISLYGGTFAFIAENAYIELIFCENYVGMRVKNIA